MVRVQSRPTPSPPSTAPDVHLVAVVPGLPAWRVWHARMRMLWVGHGKTRPVMTKSDLKKFKDALTARQSELVGLTRNREAAAIETSADALDQIQHMVERELALETLGRESAFLRETRAAPAVWMRAPLESASTVRKRSIRSGLPRYRGPPAVSPARNVRIAKAPQSGTPTNRCCRKPRNRDCEPERPGCRDHGRSRDHRRLGSGC